MEIINVISVAITTLNGTTIENYIGEYIHCVILQDSVVRIIFNDGKETIYIGVTAIINAKNTRLVLNEKLNDAANNNGATN